MFVCACCGASALVIGLGAVHSFVTLMLIRSTAARHNSNSSSFIEFAKNS